MAKSSEVVKLPFPENQYLDPKDPICRGPLLQVGAAHFVPKLVKDQCGWSFSREFPVCNDSRKILVSDTDVGISTRFYSLWSDTIIQDPAGGLKFDYATDQCDVETVDRYKLEFEISPHPSQPSYVKFMSQCRGRDTVTGLKTFLRVKVPKNFRTGRRGISCEESSWKVALEVDGLEHVFRVSFILRSVLREQDIECFTVETDTTQDLSHLKFVAIKRMLMKYYVPKVYQEEPIKVRMAEIDQTLFSDKELEILDTLKLVPTAKEFNVPIALEQEPTVKNKDLIAEVLRLVGQKYPICA